MAVGFGKPSPDEEALQDPDIQPSDAWNLPKALTMLGAMAPAAIIRLFHGTDKASARAIQAHGFDPARIGAGGDSGTPTQGWYGKGMYFTEDPKAARSYSTHSQWEFANRHPELRPAGGGKIPNTDQYSGGFKNARILETKVHDWDILDATQQQYKERLAAIMTGTPTDGRDFIMRRQQWAQGVLDEAVQSGKLGAKFSPNEYVIPDPRGLGFGEKKVR